MRVESILPLLLLAGCTVADPATVPLVCDTANPCPAGRSCADGQCSETPDLSIVLDLGIDASSDGPVPDLAEPNGCKSGTGTRLAPGEWRCQGTFGGAIKASSLCSSGYSLCTKLTAGALTACNGLPGFFASTQMGSRRDTDPVGTSRCDGAEIVKTIFGCGSGGTAASMPCSGLPRLIDCSASVLTWTCGSSLDTTSQNVSTNGVLCCS